VPVVRWRYFLLLLSSLALAACTTPRGGGDDDDANDDDDSEEPTPCPDYPESVEPMADGEVIFPYRWTSSIHGDGTEAELDLEDAWCGAEGDIAWSQSDVVLMVSLPAW
jgi:hypothetical protein